MKKSIYWIFFGVLLMMVLTGCKKPAVSYTILFETNGGSPRDSMIFKQGDTFHLPEDPTKDGYIFEGWFMDVHFNIIFTMENLLASENSTLTLYAKWSSTDSELTQILKHIYQLAIDSNTFEGTYEEWLETVRGPQGLPGEKGQDGYTPYIGENGNWFINDLDTQVFAGYYYPEIPSTGAFTFAVNSDGASYYILSYTGLDRYVSIPKYHLGYPVTSIGPSVFQDNDVIMSVFIPKFIVDIEDYAFCGAIHLENVILEEGSELETIGDYAFNEANALKSIAIPQSVTSIGDFAFHAANKLETVTIEEDSQLTYIGTYAFADASSLTEIFIPKGITDIKDHTFYRTNALQRITFEEGIQLNFIGEYAFYWNASLSEINFPETLKEIKMSAFESSTGLLSIHIPASVTDIGTEAFAGTTNVTSVTFGENSQLTGIRNYTFYLATSLTTITIPANVTWIGENAFDSASLLETVHFESGSKLTSIGRYAFRYCHKLTIVRIPTGVKTIASYAFYMTHDLTTVYIPLSVTFIGAYAFHGSSNLTICVEAFSKPDLWDTNWNSSGAPVIWGYIWM